MVSYKGSVTNLQRKLLKDERQLRKLVKCILIGETIEIKNILCYDGGYILSYKVRGKEGITRTDELRKILKEAERMLQAKSTIPVFFKAFRGFWEDKDMEDKIMLVIDMK